jgi:hypothetical protein
MLSLDGPWPTRAMRVRLALSASLWSCCVASLCAEAGGFSAQFSVSASASGCLHITAGVPVIETPANIAAAERLTREANAGYVTVMPLGTRALRCDGRRVAGVHASTSRPTPYTLAACGARPQV